MIESVLSVFMIPVFLSVFCFVDAKIEAYCADIRHKWKNYEKK